MSDIFLIVEEAMHVTERIRFLADVTRHEPTYYGASVADVLGEITDLDWDLDVVEPMIEEFGSGRDATLLAACTRAIRHGSWPLDADRVLGLYAQCEVLVAAAKRRSGRVS